MTTDVIRFRNDSGQAQKPVLQVVDVSQTWVTHFINVKSVFCHREKSLRLPLKTLLPDRRKFPTARQHCFPMPLDYLPFHSASSTLPGVMGRLVRRWSVAAPTALAMAASGGTMGTSPTPRTP